MGKTVPAYRWILEVEIERWKAYRQALTSEEERKAFDEMMDACRNYASESSCACNPVLFQPMFLSIILAQEKKITEIECKICEILWERTKPEKLPDTKRTLANQGQPQEEISLSSKKARTTTLA
jgi:hypothetical protein